MTAGGWKYRDDRNGLRGRGITDGWSDGEYIFRRPRGG